MMDTQYDAIVIGAGMAGLTAARKIGETGKKVAVLSRGLGTTNMSTGAIDLLGYAQDKLVLNPENEIRNLIKTSPKHPYSILGNGDDKKALEIVKESIKDFLKLTNMAYVGDTTQNAVLSNYFGTYRPSCIIPVTMRHGNLLEFSDAKLMAVGVRGYAEFNAKFFAKSLHYVVNSFLRQTTTNEIVPNEISIPSLGKDKEITSIEIAEALDNKEAFSRFLEQLKELIRDVNIDAVVVPAILGYKNWANNHLKLEKELGVPVFECLSLPPSVPGQRLQQILENAANDVGVEIHKGLQVLSAHIENNECNSLETIADIYRQTFKADVYVLASGSFIAEGLYFDGQEFYEPIFNLPVHKDNTNNFSERRLESRNHRIAFAGIQVNQAMRPITQNGSVITNLFAAGSILANYDYISEKSGLGVALTTGYLAGMNAINAL
ncbi:MAG: anaerobic glycerol-3-phosphate dehydrogenase subunit GlpB [Candidatus Sifarchaeia archaeon]|jgi:glycerol-3-phosphate dehydrogenase subunit B